ncbi:putative uncharacterized protein DDB_G0283431 [Protopterus annectens]|uniref:putative uncharacterized protein DDB_G0283431 n=1 Tax=Protopterus annectens TaxID=7888 RepID=UPI001CFAB208|nr:putative uncharacterized protein DDB_G0283431 [Protopterus annectens]
MAKLLNNKKKKIMRDVQQYATNRAYPRPPSVVQTHTGGNIASTNEALGHDNDLVEDQFEDVEDNVGEALHNDDHYNQCNINDGVNHTNTNNVNKKNSINRGNNSTNLNNKQGFPRGRMDNKGT